MKKAYTRTQIYKFLWEKENDGNKLTITYAQSLLPEIFKMLIEDPEGPITECSYEMFMMWANQGYTRVVMGM